MMGKTDPSHPDQATLIAALDEPSAMDPGVERHVETCEACAGRVEELRAVLDELAAEPAMPDSATLSASRQRILEAIVPAEQERARSLPGWRPLAWTSVLAAAALAALLLWNPAGEQAPVPSTADPVADAPIRMETDVEDPVAEKGERAAEAVVAAVLPTTGEAGDIDQIPLDDEAIESLAEIEGATPSMADESAYESTLLADEFASLSEEDQAAILDELSELTFDLREGSFR